MHFLDKLRCPVTKNNLFLIQKNEFESLNIPNEIQGFGQLNKGLVDNSKQYFYPIFKEIIFLHTQYAIFIGSGDDNRELLSFDKERVFHYYNQINYKVKDELAIYEDSPKWVDFRDVSSPYIKNSFKRAAQYFPAQGKYLLDIASGPIGLPEYMELSEGYEYRICVDISFNALLQAKTNMEKAHQKGIFICGDITNIPLSDTCCDAVISQHTLYHLPKNDQETAVREMYRVAKPQSKVVIVYSWFYHSWFMNLALNVVQVYRVLRHFAGKIYVRIIRSKPRLYFYAHSPRWFRSTFEFGDQIDFFCWRSTNKYFLNMYVHKYFFGKRVLKFISEMEEKHNRFMGSFGEYPVIVITKK
ncbi:MAG: methyltransferase domain-containing protein [Bacteroidota bacterium]